MPVPASFVARRERSGITNDFTDTERLHAREFLDLHRGQIASFNDQYMLDAEFDVHDIEE